MKTTQYEHPLREWRTKNGISLRELMGMLDQARGPGFISYVSLARIEAGKQSLSGDVMRGIYEVTNGEVTPNELLGCGDTSRRPPAAGLRVTAGRKKQEAKRGR